jgi:hypothetical protein
LSDGVDAIAGHSFLEISRDNNSTIYNWSPGAGKEYHPFDNTQDLDITTPDIFFSRQGKNNDKFFSYTFNTSVEQEEKIIEFYKSLSEKNSNALSTDDRKSFNVLDYNCTDIVVDAMKSGNIVDDSFSTKSWGISKPSILQNKLESKNFWQGLKDNILFRWVYPRDTNNIMNIDKREILKTKK